MTLDKLVSVSNRMRRLGVSSLLPSRMEWEDMQQTVNTEQNLRTLVKSKIKTQIWNVFNLSGKHARSKRQSTPFLFVHA